MNRVFWLLLVASLLGSSMSRAADSDLVQVEVLVFQHLNGQSDRWPMPITDDFAALPDPVRKAEEMAANLSAGGQWGQPPSVAAIGPSWPPLYTETGQHSDAFQRALERIQSSSDYRLLSSRSWIQPLTRNVRSEAVRVRSDQTLQPQPEPRSTPRLVFGRPLDPEPGQEPTHYQLDGSVTVRQRQFTHVDLDLLWQEQPPWLTSNGPLSPVASEGVKVLTHRLQTSRLVQMDRLEYFDSAWLGVIILVQEWTRPDLTDAGKNDAQAAP